MVNTTPLASDSPADPMVWTMLFSRMVEPPSRLSTEMASTAMGIDALTVRPARRPRYTVEAPKISPNSAPRMIARMVNSATDMLAAMYGWNAVAGAAGLLGVWAMGEFYIADRRIADCGLGVRTTECGLTDSGYGLQSAEVL